MRGTSFFRSLILPLLLAAVVATCPVSASYAQTHAVVLDRIVALVNDEAITWLELYKEMERELGPRLKGLGEEEKRSKLESLEPDFLDTMVNRILQLQEARKLDIFASDKEVDAAIDNIRTKFGLSMDEFVRAVEEAGSSWQDYRESLRDQIVLQKLVDREVRSRLGAEFSAQEIVETKYHLRQIFLKKDRRETELQQLLRAVYDALESGEDFGAVAMKMSEGPNAASGGDLGIMEASYLSEAMREALSGLAPGQVSPPVGSQTGVHIIKVEDIVSGQGKDMESRYRKAYDSWIRSLRDRARIDLRL